MAQRQDLFDPYLPIGAYIANLRSFIDSPAEVNENDHENPDKFGIDFHWDDWSDLRNVDAFFRSYRKTTKKNALAYFSENEADALDPDHDKSDNDYVTDSELGSFIEHDPSDREHAKVKALRGAASLYCCRPIPERILYLTEEKFFIFPVKGKKLLGRSGLKKIYEKSTGKKLSKTDRIDIKQEILDLKESYSKKFPDYISELKKSKIETDKKTMVEVDESRFRMDPQKELDVLFDREKKGETLSKLDSDFKNFLKYSLAHVDNAPQWFKFPLIHGDNDAHAHHFAYPFFKRVISNRERHHVINRLSRAWFQFCMAYDIATWVNWGSLIGWSFNGLNLPYDSDIDVNIPIQDLAWLGRHFNKTILIEDPAIGTSRFYFEVDPWYITQGSGQNFIDARIIDIRTGIYIDISALSVSNRDPPDNLYEGGVHKKESSVAVNCKNWNWLILDDVLPLRRTLFEGYKALIPKEYNRIMDKKYGHDSYTRTGEYNGHLWDPDTKLWVPKQMCESIPSNENNKRFDSDGYLTLEGACGSKLYQEDYKRFKPAVDLHEQEFKLIEEGKDTHEIITKTLEPLRPDAWEIYHDIVEKYG